MAIKLALAGNPNSGKTTMFNDLTGSSQYVGNWPGVTVEKKEGKLRGHKEVIIMDLPGIYSLSPYTLEEVISRNYILEEKPDAIINIVDATNLERNLYLTTQLLEIGIPIIVALNMMDIVKKSGDKIDVAKLQQELGCPVVETSAAKGTGLKELIDQTLSVAQGNKKPGAKHRFSPDIEQALSSIEEILQNKLPLDAESRWYAIKVFERDSKVTEKLSLAAADSAKIAAILSAVEDKLDDDTESIITNERYEAISSMLKKGYRKVKTGLTTSDKIDRIVTNKWLALPIFFAIMWAIYYVSISTVGDITIGWVESLFGWLQEGAVGLLEGWGASEPIVALIGDGIIGSLGAIFIYVPQLMILFLFLSVLEDSGYMARVAFIMDRIFRKFGLSGKSFIPMLIGTGCSIPGIMASRTIENEKDRRMTIILTPFIPCGAKLPIFAMFIAMMFPNDTWVGPSVYLIGIVGVILSGIFLKKTKAFKGDPAPFVMELPNYKFPQIKGVVIHMWEKAKSFVKKAGSVIFIACAVLWVLQSFNFSFEYLGPEGIDSSILASIGNAIKWLFVPMGFGDSWAPALATITGLVAKEVVVATFASVGSVIPIVFSQVSAFAFIVFTIFAAPCFAAIGAMKRELGSWKWTLRAVGYQTGLAYVLATIVNLVGGLIFAGTAAVQPQALDFTLMEEASEGAVIGGDIVLIVFAAILVVALGIIIYNRLKGSKKYAPHTTVK
ncbi:MAG: ferrous iron transport protein B [Christensenellales bacterium]|jgi:ferrous iron transport protein B